MEEKSEYSEGLDEGSDKECIAVNVSFLYSIISKSEFEEYMLFWKLCEKSRNTSR